MFASWKGHEGIVTLLLAKGANPNVLSGEIPAHFETIGDIPPTTALAEAIKTNHLTIAKILIENGALIDKNSIALVGETGDIDLAKFMLKKGADFDISSSVSYYPSALCTASRTGKLKMVKFLINNGANPNKIHLTRHIALQEAVFHSQLEVVRYLLEHKANPNIVLDSTTTVLYTAITAPVSEENFINNYEIIKLLLNYGADRFFKPYNSAKTIVDIAKKQYNSFQQSNSKNKEVSEYLLKKLELLTISQCEK